MSERRFGESMVIPDHTREVFERYFRHGYEPGSFGRAVLCNDLHMAIMRADRDNRALLYQIVYWLQENAPRGSWGSPELVQGWLNKNKWFEAYQKHLTFEILSEE
jgi:hypothetical protein